MWNLYQMLADSREQDVRREVRARYLQHLARRVRPRSAAVPGQGGRRVRPAAVSRD